VDNDPQAITASWDNAARNQVDDATFSAVLPDDASVRSALASADWVVANILAGPLIDLAPNLMSLIAPGGRLLLAGLLSDQVEEVVAAYAATVNLRVVDQVGDWVLLAGQRTE
jgi:ribosomal protein L11 methyltransferase